MSLEVKACAALTEPERAEILALQNEVYSGENLKNTVWLQTESHFDRTVPCFYLGRENDALTAFLSLFLPTQEEAEVTAFTKQSARNCGQFTALLHAAAKDAHRQLRQIEVKQQAPDHPILWGVPETNYLKFFLFQVI